MSVYLHTNTGLPLKLRFYVYQYVEGVVVVQINHIDTYFIKNTVLESILC